MKDIFDSYIENAFDGRHQAAFKFKQYGINYRRFFPQDPSARLLDIGIGRGEMLSCMRDWGYTEYLGVDISASAVNFCRSLGLKCVLIDDARQWLSERDSAFDLITLLDVLEHFKKEDVIAFLKSLFGALKPEGKLIIQVPNMQAPDPQLHRYNDLTHHIGFTEHSLQQAFIASGISNFRFSGFEEITKDTLKAEIQKMLRSLYWRCCRLIRGVNTNLNPEILNPVLFAIAVKSPLPGDAHNMSLPTE
jgi:2-polyprenyl-3-methyl-5-hydroxy-6-metoxy-1,4-benzoquinol methylase